MIDKNKYQTIEQTAVNLGVSISGLRNIRLNPEMQFPKKIIINGKVYFEADSVKKQEEQRIEEVNY